MADETDRDAISPYRWRGVVAEADGAPLTFAMLERVGAMMKFREDATYAEYARRHEPIISHALAAGVKRYHELSAFLAAYHGPWPLVKDMVISQNWRTGGVRISYVERVEPHRLTGKVVRGPDMGQRAPFSWDEAGDFKPEPEEDYY